jgi:hypothetical protein
MIATVMESRKDRLRRLESLIDDARGSLSSAETRIAELIHAEDAAAPEASSRDRQAIDAAVRFLGPVLRSRRDTGPAETAAIAEICRQWLADRAGWRLP